MASGRQTNSEPGHLNLEALFCDHQQGNANSYRSCGAAKYKTGVYVCTCMGLIGVIWLLYSGGIRDIRMRQQWPAMFVQCM